VIVGVRLFGVTRQIEPGLALMRLRLRNIARLSSWRYWNRTILG